MRELRSTEESGNATNAPRAVSVVVPGHIPQPDQCIRCGACLPGCPTFAATGLERESPRGRTQLVGAVADGRLEADDYFLRQMFDCLDCRACEPLCPVGVPIGSLVLAGRTAALQETNPARSRPSAIARFGRWVLERVFFARPRRMEWPVGLTRWLYQRTGLQRIIRASGLLRPFGLVSHLETWLPELPDQPWRRRFPDRGERIGPDGPPRLRAAYFLGCFMNTVFADASVATVEVLRRNSVEVLAPIGVQCCGAPQMDLGDVEIAREFARTNTAALLETGAPVVFSDCAACSGMLKEYGELLADDPAWSERAADLSSRVRDFSELMLELAPGGPPLGPVAATLTWHDPCHLANLQGVRQQPRELLRQIPGVALTEMCRADACCGSAGTYSFRRWDESMAILGDKIANAAATGADVVVTANPGCLGQLQLGMRLEGRPVDVRHLSQVLLESYEAGEARSSEPAAGR